MSRQNNQNDNFLTTVLTNALGLVIAAFLLAMPAVMLAIFYFLKRPISRALHLEWHSARWTFMKWLYRPIKWLAAFLFLFVLANASNKLSPAPAHTDQIIAGILELCVGLSFGLLFNVMHWMEQYARDPAIQKKMAGIAAERYVQKIIEENQHDFPASRSLHGKLFVFNAHTPSEFSVEADHILITERNIFVIETKCKSGTLFAGADAPKWKVSSPYGDGEMRNALKQAKNAARVLQRQAVLPCEVIPLVAIKGNDVKIVDGPTNVLVTANLVNVIRAFEHSKPHPVLDPAAVTALLLPHMNGDPAAMDRHIERAQAARVRAEMTEIVNAASIR
jgi:hypothetical protein